MEARKCTEIQSLIAIDCDPQPIEMDSARSSSATYAEMVTKKEEKQNSCVNCTEKVQKDYKALKEGIKCFQSGGLQSGFRSGVHVATFIRYISLCVNNGSDNVDNFDLLVDVLDHMPRNRKQNIMEKVLPLMQQLILQMHAFLRIIDRLEKSNLVVSLTRQEIFGVLSASFFCCFPQNAGHDKGKMLTFAQLYQKEYGFLQESANNCKKEKIKCLLHYFEFAADHIGDKVMLEVVTFKRNLVSAAPDWASSTKTIRKLKVIDTKLAPIDTRTRIDFAHQNIGGGVLSSGCLQEEILFITCPELIVSRFFSSEMAENEAIIIDGVRQYSDFEGYAESFHCTGACHSDLTFEVAAMDALNFNNYTEQYQYRKPAVDRELTKAYAAFTAVKGSKIASGNWGGGCFKGDPVLKAKIQMIAASQAKKEVQYVTFETPGLACDIEIVNLLTKESTVGKAYSHLMRWCEFKMEKLTRK